LANNLALGWPELLSKSFRFAKSTVTTRCLLHDVERVGVGVRVEGVAPVIDNRGGIIVLGDDVVLSSPRTPIHMALRLNAVLRIGERTWVNDGVWFGCTQRITIGERVLIGPGVRIFDNDYHDFYQRWRAPAARPVTIGDDVWIASDAIVLRGVEIGRGAVVGAASVVLEDVEPFTVVVGNPARVVKRLDPQLFEPSRPD
jgi:acetyltransferase-like isoleucine patch superfamily enzyme